MCDYSLHHVTSRPARIEDRLVTTKFSNSITCGSPQSASPMSPSAYYPAPKLRLTVMSSVRHLSGSGFCRTRRSDSGSPVSGRSIWTTPPRTMMRWNFRTGR
jgi:hypothetical protein